MHLSPRSYLFTPTQFKYLFKLGQLQCSLAALQTYIAVTLKSLLWHVQCTLHALSSMVFESAHEHCGHACSLRQCSSRAIHSVRIIILHNVFQEKTNLRHILAALTHYTCTVPLVELGDLWRRCFPTRTHELNLTNDHIPNNYKDHSPIIHGLTILILFPD